MEEVGKDLHLLGTIRECVHKGIKMNVYETIGSGWFNLVGWCGWGDNVHGKRTPLILAGEFDAENGTKQELLPSLDPNYLLLL